MGMAASQARYLALTARKTNVEYEGQQINQARTSLANQSANYFNQMLGMKVPTPPSIRDYTTVQYSFTDGYNTEVLSNYYQLGNNDSDYNYVVTTYHNEKVFTGSKKRLNDPQVQATILNSYSYNPADYDQNDQKIVSKAWFDASDGTYGIETSEGQTTIFRPVTEKETDQIKAINKGLGNVVTNTVQEFDHFEYEVTEQAAQDASGATWSALDVNDEDDIAFLKEELGATFPADPADIPTFAATFWKDGTGNYISDTDHGPANITNATIYTLNKTEVMKDVEVPTEEGLGVNLVDDGNGNMVASPDQNFYTDGKIFITKADLDSAVEKYNKYVETGYRQKNDVNYIIPQNDRTAENYTAIGNCTLTELTAADLADEDIAATIDQIIKDMNKVDGDTLASENLAACFEMQDDGTLKYIGGLYTFKMGGQTYYTTRNDLDASVTTSIVDNDIDVQQKKLNYYQASYLDTKVEDTQKALLETDGKGRFKTMKLEDDSVVYTLNAEEVTDEASYNDAMNRYYYENAIYEQTLQEINAKTEIIQAQDRTLELRLEQLNTEQSALQNEMEAVKKVVDKHVELGFKTFGG